jgi:hypothetical protein
MRGGDVGLRIDAGTGVEPALGVAQASLNPVEFRVLERGPGVVHAQDGTILEQADRERLQPVK